MKYLNDAAFQRGGVRKETVEEESMNLFQSQKLDGVHGPVHVVPDPLVELDKVFHGDDMVGVEVEDVVEEILELVLLEICEQILADDRSLLLSNVVRISAVDEGAPHVLAPLRVFH